MRSTKMVATGAAILVTAVFTLLIAPLPHAAAQQGTFIELTDLDGASAQPTDGASAQLDVAVFNSSMSIALWVTGLDTGYTGTLLGARVHVGPCVAGDASAAGTAYNVTGQPPTRIDNVSEVWLQLEIDNDGRAYGSVFVPFEIPPFEADSIVIYDTPIGPGGVSGTPLACLGVPWLTDAELSERALLASTQAPDADEVLGLAVTGPSHTGQLAAIGSSLVALGSLLVWSSAVTMRRSSVAANNAAARPRRRRTY